MTRKEYQCFIEENPVVATVDSDHSCMNFKVCKGINGYSIVVDDATSEEQFYIAASERTVEAMIEWLDCSELPAHSVNKIKEIFRRG